MLVPMFPALEDADATKNILFHAQKLPDGGGGEGGV